jgi:hypothetical protein
MPTFFYHESFSILTTVTVYPPRFIFDSFALLSFTFAGLCQHSRSLVFTPFAPCSMTQSVVDQILNTVAGSFDDTLIDVLSLAVTRKH